MRVELPPTLAGLFRKDTKSSVRLVIEYDRKEVSARRAEHRKQLTLLQVLSPRKALELLRKQLSGNVAATVTDGTGQEGITISPENTGEPRHYHRRSIRPPIDGSADIIEDYFREQVLQERYGKHGKGRY